MDIIWISEELAFDLVQNNMGVLFDCRGIMDDLEASLANFHDNHIEGAEYVHSVLTGQNQLTGGRHPLPDLNHFYDYVTSIAQDRKIIAYDNRNSFYGTRFVFLCHLVGLDCLLIQEGYEDIKRFNKLTNQKFVEVREATIDILECSVDEFKMAEQKFIQREKTDFNIQFNHEMLATCSDIKSLIDSDDQHSILIDARAHERFIGKTEPIDSKPGHIPHAINIPYTEIYQDNIPKDRAALQQLFKPVLGKELIVYCGSGLSATPLYVALKTLDENVKLYAGSYSEWISQYPKLIETGE